MNPLASINGKAAVVSAEVFKARYPSGKVPRSSRDYGKIFICRRGCNTRTATYTDEFIWEDTYHGVEDLLDLIDYVKNQTKATRKRKRNADDPAVDVGLQSALQCSIAADRLSTILITTNPPPSPVHLARKSSSQQHPLLRRLPNAPLRSNTSHLHTNGSL